MKRQEKQFEYVNGRPIANRAIFKGLDSLQVCEFSKRVCFEKKVKAVKSIFTEIAENCVKHQYGDLQSKQEAMEFSKKSKVKLEESIQYLSKYSDILVFGNTPQCNEKLWKSLILFSINAGKVREIEAQDKRGLMFPAWENSAPVVARHFNECTEFRLQSANGTMVEFFRPGTEDNPKWDCWITFEDRDELPHFVVTMLKVAADSNVSFNKDWIRNPNSLELELYTKFKGASELFSCAKAMIFEETPRGVSHFIDKLEDDVEFHRFNLS